MHKAAALEPNLVPNSTRTQARRIERPSMNQHIVRLLVEFPLEGLRLRSLRVAERRLVRCFGHAAARSKME